MLQFTKDDIMRGVELGVMCLLGLIVLFFVVRPLVRRIITPEAGGRQLLPDGAVGPRRTAARCRQAAITPPAQCRDRRQRPNVAISNHTSAMIDIAQVQGQVHAQSVQKVGELADRNPHETVADHPSMAARRGISEQSAMPSAYEDKPDAASKPATTLRAWSPNWRAGRPGPTAKRSRR